MQAQQELAEKEADKAQREEIERASRLAEERKHEELRKEQKLRLEKEKKRAMEDFLGTDITDDPTTEHFGCKISLSPGGPTFDAVRLGNVRSGQISCLVCTWSDVSIIFNPFG
jgi:hypothetical protein